MFGFGKKKNKKVMLSPEELQFLEANMSKKQLKEFRRRQKDLEDEEFEEGFDEGFLLGMIFEDDD